MYEMSFWPQQCTKCVTGGTISVVYEVLLRNNSDKVCH